MAKRILPGAAMCALRDEKMDRFALEPQILEFHSGEPAPVRRRRSGERPRKEGLARKVMESSVFKCRYVSHECIYGKNLALVSPIQHKRNAKGCPFDGGPPAALPLWFRLPVTQQGDCLRLERVRNTVQRKKASFRTGCGSPCGKEAPLRWVGRPAPIESVGQRRYFTTRTGISASRSTP